MNFFLEGGWEGWCELGEGTALKEQRGSWEVGQREMEESGRGKSMQGPNQGQRLMTEEQLRTVRMKGPRKSPVDPVNSVRGYWKQRGEWERSRYSSAGQGPALLCTHSRFPPGPQGPGRASVW